jgi:hypothetical protein
MRSYKFQFEIICAGPGEPDLSEVERLIDLSCQDLVYDDNFVSALAEESAVTIQVTRIG